MIHETLVVALAALLPSTVPAGVQLPPVVEQLEAGVYAVVRRDPLGLAVNSNSLVVIGSDAVLVVDAQFTREATLETLRAIRALTRLPVRYVVNTHWHDDHLAGNQVYRDTFPDVQFVMHENTRSDAVALGAPNREGTIRAAPPVADRFQRLLAQGLGIDSTALVPGERESLQSALRIIRTYLAEADAFRATFDGPSVTERWSADLGGRRVEARWFGRGNTRGDLVVTVPDARVTATGDLVVAPVPFAFGSFPSEWIAVLDSLMAMRPAVLVPGHGAVMRDFRYVNAVRGALVAITDAARVAASRGDSTARLLRETPLDASRSSMAGDDVWLSRLFDRFLRVPALTAALQQERSRKP